MAPGFSRTVTITLATAFLFSIGWSALANNGEWLPTPDGYVWPPAIESPKIGEFQLVPTSKLPKALCDLLDESDVWKSHEVPRKVQLLWIDLNGDSNPEAILETYSGEYVIFAKRGSEFSAIGEILQWGGFYLAKKVNGWYQLEGSWRCDALGRVYARWLMRYQHGHYEIVRSENHNFTTGEVKILIADNENGGRTDPDQASQPEKSAERPSSDAPYADLLRNDPKLAGADQELNEAYAALQHQLSPEARNALKVDQIAWIKKRDSDASQAGKDLPGPECRQARIEFLRDATEKRASELKKRQAAAPGAYRQQPEGSSAPTNKSKPAQDAAIPIPGAEPSARGDEMVLVPMATGIDPNEFIVVFRKAGSKEIVGADTLTQFGGHFTAKDLPIKTVMWNSSGDYVAFDLRTERHYSRIFIYRITDSVTPVPVPDHWQQLFAQLGNSAEFRGGTQKIVQWIDNTHLEIEDEGVLVDETSYESLVTLELSGTVAAVQSVKVTNHK